ncbi:MAG: hypothetical protein ACJAUV_002146 [Flavobacteriales bacterium]|jgi:hypothetical protein
MVKQLIISFLLLSSVQITFGQFDATVSKTTVGQNENVEYTLTLGGNGTNYKAPSFEGFTVVSGPNQSSRTEIINGKHSQSIALSYALRAKSKGQKTIGSASITINKKNFSTKPITIKVVEGSTDPALQAMKDNVFLQVEASKYKAFVGEQVTLTYKLYTAENVGNLQYAETPKFNGFWVEDIDMPENLPTTNEVINGRQFRVITIKKAAVFPQKSGVLDITPMKIDLTVQQRARSRSMFDDFFGSYKNIPYTAVSNKMKLTINALPQTGKPSNFKGIVGEYSLNANIDKTTLQANESATLKITIYGKGNVKKLPAPSLSLPSDIEVYDPKIKQSISKGSSVLSGSKTYDYLLIPRREGVYIIPSQEYIAFNPRLEKYERLKTPEYQLKVGESDEKYTINTPGAGISKEDLELLGEDIRFIKTKTSFKESNEQFVGSTGFYGGFAAPVLLFFLALGYRKKMKEQLGDVKGQRQKKATAKAKKRLILAKKELDDSNQSKFYVEIQQALIGFICDKTGLEPNNTSIESLQTTLSKNNLPNDVIESFTETVKHCDHARYAPSYNNENMNVDYDNAVKLIVELGENLKA